MTLIKKKKFSCIKEKISESHLKGKSKYEPENYELKFCSQIRTVTGFFILFLQEPFVLQSIYSY